MTHNSAILCVDDEIMVLETLKEQLQRSFGENYICELAESADEAWEIADELSEEGIQLLVIVSDWLMPGTKGDEFLIQIHQRFPSIATIMLTGQADATAIERVEQEANLYACLHKPWQESELIQVISCALG